MSGAATTTPARSAGRPLGAVLGAVALVIALGAAGVVIGLRIANEGVEPHGQNWWLVAWLVVGAVDLVAGAALVTRSVHRRVAACLVIAGASALLRAVAVQAGGDASSIDGDTAWAEVADAAGWAWPTLAGFLAALLPWELATFARRRVVEGVWWVTAAGVAVAAFGAAAHWRLHGPDASEIASTLVAVSAAAASAALVGRWWRARGEGDDPLPGWIAAGAVVAWLAVVPAGLDLEWHLPSEDVIGPLLLLATVPLLTAGTIVDALRGRPGRFHGVAHEVIGWLVLSGGIVVLYTGVVAGLGRMVGGDGPTWLLVATTGVIAVTIEPVRRRIRHTVDRLVWGARDDPLEVVRGVVDHVGADSGDELLPALVASLQRELRLDAVAIDVRTAHGWQREAAVGSSTTYERVVELEQQGEVVGRLVVGWEHGPSLRDRDERILAELAGPLGLAVGWVRLAADLRRSSLAVVSAREEERRRLRRDLHDGLGPALTGVSLGLRTALRQLERSPDADALVPSRRLLAQAADEVDRLVVDVKRIVRDLRPTALDQLGLVGAVAEFTRTFADELKIHVSMSSDPVELPAAVEVATYRIVTEAVTNVVRHARAARCWLTISIAETIEIDVVDDGVGVDGTEAAGVGWTAMRERAEELGGTVHVEPRAPHGTCVHVRLPAVLP